MIPEQFRLIATSAALVRAAGPAAALWVGNAIAAQDWSEKENKESWWWATKSEIEERTGLSDEMQETARRRLRDLGVLEERRGILRRGASLATIWYRIDWSKLSAIVCREPRQSNADEPGNRAPETPANDHASLTPSLTAEEQHPPTPQGGRKRSRVPLDSSMFDSLIPIDFQTPEFLEAWHLYVEDRHQRRKTVTDKSAELQIRALVKDAGTPATAAKWIKHSIAQGWTGIFPPKSDAPPRGPRPGPSFRTTADTALADQLARRNHAPAQPNADAVDPGW